MTCGIALAVLAMGASSARAQEVEDGSQQSAPLGHASSGIYVGLAAVYAIELFDSPIDGGNSFGWAPSIGYRFHAHGAIETQFESITSLAFDDPRISDEFSKEIDPVIWSVNGKYFLLTERIQPYALVGAGLLLPGMANPYFRTASSGAAGSSTIDTAFTVEFGGGVDYYLTEDLALALNAVYTMPIGSGLPEQIPYLSISWGLLYRFRFLE